jgi:hypothetical protein
MSELRTLLARPIVCGKQRRLCKWTRSMFRSVFISWRYSKKEFLGSFNQL